MEVKLLDTSLFINGNKVGNITKNPSWNNNYLAQYDGHPSKDQFCDNENEAIKYLVFIYTIIGSKNV